MITVRLASLVKWQMEQSPHLSKLFHVRMISCLFTLWVVDFVLLLFATESILLEGPSVMIMFASEYMILIATVWSTTIKYGLNVIDLRSEVPWESKSLLIFYVDMATGMRPANLRPARARLTLMNTDFLKLCTYLAFFSLILTFYGLPLNTLRDVYITARSFILKVRDLLRYREATRNMDERYPDATVEELGRMNDQTCIICREDMVSRRPAVPVAANGQAVAPAPAPPPPRQGPNDTPKKLPCGHVFHFHCLRSWLERQQSCPTWSAICLEKALRDLC